MRKSLLILLLLSVTNSFSQDVYKTLLEGTYWGQPFELRQVTLSSEDGCNQFSHSQVLWYFKNENEPEKMDIGILTFNQLEDWKTFILMISGVADLKEVGYSKTNIVYKNFVAFINETQPLFISIITNPENKLALIRKNFFSEEETNERYLDKIGQLWQNDKCEGGILIDYIYLTRSLYSPATSIPAEYPISSRIICLVFLLNNFTLILAFILSSILPFIKPLIGAARVVAFSL